MVYYKIPFIVSDSLPALFVNTATSQILSFTFLDAQKKSFGKKILNFYKSGEGSYTQFYFFKEKNIKLCF